MIHLGDGLEAHSRPVRRATLLPVPLPFSFGGMTVKQGPLTDDWARAVRISPMARNPGVESTVESRFILSMWKNTTPVPVSPNEDESNAGVRFCREGEKHDGAEKRP